MKNFKRVIAVLLAVVLMLSFTACGKGKVKSSKENGSTVWYLGDSDDKEIKSALQNAENIDTDSIYSSLTYNEEILKGSYAVDDLKKDIKKYKKQLSFTDISLYDGDYHASTLPVSVSCGKSRMPLIEGDLEDYEEDNIAALGFIVGDEVGTVPCVYEVNGNKIKFTALDRTDDGFSLGTQTFEYDFELKGLDLILKANGESIDLKTYTFTSNAKDASNLYFSAYSKTDSALVDGMDYFFANQSSSLCTAYNRNGHYYDKLAFRFSDDGTFTVYLKYQDGEDYKEFVKRYAYVIQVSPFLSNFSMSLVLFDGEKVYYYNDSQTDRTQRIMASQGVDDLSDDELKKIADTTDDLYDDLSKEFEANGITVQINRESGEISMDSTVLFGGDSAELTDDGKEFLNKFIKAYTNVVNQDKYSSFIENTVIEGHIAPVGNATYESGLALSTERAENVKDYCLSGETGVDTTKFAETVQTKGMSLSQPIYDENGDVDVAASRRVSFSFTVNLDSIK